MTRSTPVEVCFTPDAQYVISGKYLTVYYIHFLKLYYLYDCIFFKINIWHSFAAL